MQYSELSTPLSVEDFTSHHGGAIYGLKGTPKRYSSTELLNPSPIPGLYLSGSDASSLGVAGAMMGGVVAASRVLGPFGLFKVFGAISKPPSRSPTICVNSADKLRAFVKTKAPLSPSIWRLEFELQNSINFTPGQFVSLQVAPFEWRNYSIASVEANRFELLVSTRTGGDGSIYTKQVKPGEETLVELPFGSYHLQLNSHRRVFVATGTGIAPFLPMFASLEALGEFNTSELLFGCSRAEDNIISGNHFKHLPSTTVCISRDAGVNNTHHGRVTEVLARLQFDPSVTDFYLCGAPAMVDECRDLLAIAGATQVLTEPF